MQYPQVVGIEVYDTCKADDNLLGEVIVRPGFTRVAHVRQMIEDVRAVCRGVACMLTMPPLCRSWTCRGTSR